MGEIILKFFTPDTTYLNEKLKNGEKISVIGTLTLIATVSRRNRPIHECMSMHTRFFVTLRASIPI